MGRIGCGTLSAELGADNDDGQLVDDCYPANTDWTSYFESQLISKSKSCHVKRTTMTGPVVKKASTQPFNNTHQLAFLIS